jgi:hypothetical protein
LPLHNLSTPCPRPTTTGRRAALDCLCSVLQDNAAAAAQQLPGLVNAAALLLRAAAENLDVLRSGFCAADAGAPRALHVLRALHIALGAAAAAQGGDHGVHGRLRGIVAVRLALLLADTGDLHRARAAAGAAVEVLEEARVEAAAARRGEEDEHLLWASAGRAQVEATAKTAMRGEPPLVRLVTNG